jgi:hypothetical protein
MPLKEKRKIMKSARRAGLHRGSERWNAYVYGTEAKIKKRRAAKRKRGKR